MLLIIEKGIRGRICHAIHRYTEANNKYMKKSVKNKESSYLKYRDVNNFYGQAMSQKLPVNDINPNLSRGTWFSFNNSETVKGRNSETQKLTKSETVNPGILQH